MRMIHDRFDKKHKFNQDGACRCDCFFCWEDDVGCVCKYCSGLAPGHKECRNARRNRRNYRKSQMVHNIILRKIDDWVRIWTGNN